MADPSYDDARDVRAALGALLVDEPRTPSPVADDVARGRALRHRRRVRVATGTALVAVLVLVVGLVGPLRPGQDAPVSPAGPSVSASPSPTDYGPRVSALLADLGWVVDSMVIERVPYGSPSVTTWTVHDRSSAAPLSAQLTVRAWDSGSWGDATTRPRGSVLGGCTAAKACGVVSETILDCVSTVSPCWSTSSTTVEKPFAGMPAGTSVLLAYDDGARRAVEAVATPAECVTCASAVQAAAFLTPAQLSRVVALVQPDPTTSPAPTSSPTDRVTALPACRPGELKIIPGEGSPTETAGSSGLWVEVHARNPEVDCVLRGRPLVQLLDRQGVPLGVPYAQGIYLAADFADGPVEVSQAVGPARFALTQPRCDGPQDGIAEVAVVQVSAGVDAVPVELVAGATQLTTCPGGPADPTSAVHVSRYTR